MRGITLATLLLLAVNATAAVDFAKLQKDCGKSLLPFSKPCVKLSEALEILARGCKSGVAADCAQIASLARTKGDTSGLPVAYLTNAAILSEVARDASYSIKSRQAAVDHALMTDQAVLAEVARAAAVGDDTKYLAEAAVAKLFDQAALAAVAKTARDDWLVGLTAIRRLTDRKALEDVVANATAPSRQRAARERLADIGSTTVTGVLVEEVTGKPLAEYPFSLGLLPAITDGEGRFRLTTVKAGEWELQGARGTLTGPDGAVKLKVPASGEAALGSIVVRESAQAGHTLTGLCAPGAQRPDVPANVKLLVLFDRSGKWEYDYGWAKAAAWAAPWQGVLCVKEDTVVTGQYRDSTGGSAGAAQTAIWTVRLTRVSDGQIFETTFKEKPPRESSGGYGATGDPSPKLQKWLAEMR